MEHRHHPKTVHNNGHHHEHSHREKKDRRLKLVIFLTGFMMVVEEVAMAIKGLDRVRDVHDIHIWQITSGMYPMTGHVVMEEMPFSKLKEHCIESTISWMRSSTFPMPTSRWKGRVIWKNTTIERRRINSRDAPT